MRTFGYLGLLAVFAPLALGACDGNAGNDGYTVYSPPPPASVASPPGGPTVVEPSGRPGPDGGYRC
jgi:hypothetical protein